MNFFLTIILDGLIQASWLFIVALGLTLVFGVLKILNIAHGSFYALGAYIAATVVTLVAARSLAPSVGFIAMLLAVALVAGAVGLLLERGLLKMLYGRDEVVLLLVTYAVFLVLEDVTKLIWGVNPIYATQPYELLGNLEFAGLYCVGYDLVLIPISAAIGFAIWFGLNRTITGKIVLAVIHNEEMSVSMGVRVNRVYAFSFAFGVLLAALAGALTAPKISMQPGLSSDVIILSFAIVVIGGLGCRHSAVFPCVSRGAMVGVVGRNGAGKTTLMRSIMGHLKPAQGIIRFEGTDLTARPRHTRAALGIGYMPEDRSLVPQLTVEENVLLPLWVANDVNRKARLEFVYEAIRGLTDMRDRKALLLSGGQQKLVALGRALAIGTKCLLLDEPFEGIAPALSKRLSEVLASLRGKDLTLLMSQSDMNHSRDLIDAEFTIERGANRVAA